MNEILSDASKFVLCNEVWTKLIWRLEDKINRILRDLKKGNKIDQVIFDNLLVTGSNLGFMYGLPKVHKPGNPMRPILSACSQASFKLAKFLVPWLAPFAQNQFTLSNSYTFANLFREQNPKYFMVSFAVSSLFTNVPLNETIDIIIKKGFQRPTDVFHNLDSHTFKRLLGLAVRESYFMFDKKIYMQVDGVAMGSPLGPTLANVFMVHLEEIIMSKCPPNFKPVFYWRYVVDTIALFRDRQEAEFFKVY